MIKDDGYVLINPEESTSTRESWCF